jgi:hypothetical protein
MPPPRVYLPLLNYLAALPAAPGAVTLSFAELEAILGFSLPASARALTFYWRTSNAARLNWNREGWDAHLDRLGHAVTFTRR